LLFLLVGTSECMINDTCVVNPSIAACADYELPTKVVDTSIQNLCGTMGNMYGCSVNKICQDKQYSSGLYCNDFGIYKELCEDFGNGTQCEDINSMCSPKSVVKECATKVLPLPSSMALVKLVKDICSKMEMPGCEKCTGAGMIPCDVLTIYSNLCLSMSDMEQCADWKAVCSLVPSWPICSESGNNVPPEMRMYFHTSLEDYVLLESWVPRTVLQYVLAWFAVFFFAFFIDAFRLARLRLENAWKRSISIPNLNTDEHLHHEEVPLLGNELRVMEPKNPPFRIGVDIPRALLQFVETAWALLIMLVAMTFNVGLFLAICAGAAFGSLIFGRYLSYSASDHHH